MRSALATVAASSHSLDRALTPVGNAVQDASPTLEARELPRPRPPEGVLQARFTQGCGAVG